MDHFIPLFVRYTIYTHYKWNQSVCFVWGQASDVFNLNRKGRERESVYQKNWASTEWPLSREGERVQLYNYHKRRGRENGGVLNHNYLKIDPFKSHTKFETSRKPNFSIGFLDIVSSFHHFIYPRSIPLGLFVEDKQDYHNTIYKIKLDY